MTEKVAVKAAVFVVLQPCAGGLPHGDIIAPGITKIGSPTLFAGAVPVYEAATAVPATGENDGVTVPSVNAPFLTVSVPPVTTMDWVRDAHDGRLRNTLNSVSFP